MHPAYKFDFDLEKNGPQANLHKD